MDPIEWEKMVIELNALVALFRYTMLDKFGNGIELEDKTKVDNLNGLKRFGLVFSDYRI